MSGWSAAEIPPLQGKVAIVTGATGGLGQEAAQELAGAGAETILAGRNAVKGQAAIATIRDKFPAAEVRFEGVDLADLASVTDFAERYSSTHPSLDILINNAGVMALPRRQTTVDGFEMQFGTNFLGHFALTARLLPQLRAAPAPRLVNLSSIAHRTGTIDFGDLQGDRFYLPWKAYGQSKLAMLMFALELQRRSDAAGWKLTRSCGSPGMGANRPLHQRSRGARVHRFWRDARRADFQSIRRRWRVAHPVRRDISRRRTRRILRA